MTGFDDRRAAFENKFKHDEEKLFKINVRTSKIFGLWAAEHLNFLDKEAEAYADTVVEADFEEPGFEDVIRKVAADFKDKKLDISMETMYEELEKAQGKAEEQVSTGDAA